MKTITVVRELAAPIEKVFDVITDHANYSKFPGVKKSTLVRPGSSERNGVGALREIDVGKAVFTEQITAFERPVRMDYLIVKSRPPLKHDGGSVRLSRTGTGTRVEWTTTFAVGIPLLGGLLTKIMAPQLEGALVSMLKATEQRAA